MNAVTEDEKHVLASSMSSITDPNGGRTFVNLGHIQFSEHRRKPSEVMNRIYQISRCDMKNHSTKKIIHNHGW